MQSRQLQTRRVLLVRHMPNEPEDAVSRWLKRNGYETVDANPAEGLALPQSLSDVDATVVYGGAQSVNDKSLSYLQSERQWLQGCLDIGQPVFAICLGAQLLAQVLGTEVFSLPDQRKEIGWTRVTPTDNAGGPWLDRPLHFFQWHGEGFNVPSTATPFADGEVFPNQGYSYGDSVVATQFHPEVDDEIIRLWIAEASHQIKMCPLDSAQPAQQHLDTQRYLPAAAIWLDRTLSNWSRHIASTAAAS